MKTTEKTTGGSLGYSKAKDNALKRKRKMDYKAKKSKCEKEKVRWN
tara:strand:+ start:2884 stop:3021 length:138 start_codon:yes stop_codon:yes gene_type:complete